MENNLFNSAFEMELRITVLLAADDSSIYSVGRILSLDFIACYAEKFGFADTNLHGDNAYMFCELSTRRALIQEAIKSLVLQGIIDVILKDGYLYRITEIGKRLSLSLESEYAKEYRDIVGNVIKEFGNYSDEQLIQMIQFKSDTKKEE